MRKIDRQLSTIRIFARWIWCGMLITFAVSTKAQSRLGQANQLISLRDVPRSSILLADESTWLKLLSPKALAASDCAPLSPCSGPGCPTSSAYPGTINTTPLPATIRGTDAEFNLVVGGNFVVPYNGGTGVEGRIAVGGNFTMDNPYYGVGVSTGGAYVIAPDAEYNLVVKGQIFRTLIANGAIGNVQPSGGVATGKMIAGSTFASNVIGTNNTATYRVANAGTSAINAIIDISTLVNNWTSKSACYATKTTTGAFNSSTHTLTGDGTSATQVFALTPSDINSLSGQNLLFAGIPANARIMINVPGTSLSWNVANVAASIANHPTDYATLGGSDPDVDVRNVIFNFYQATSLTINTPINGAVLVPLGNVDLKATINGRVVVGGNLSHSGLGTEIHNYPFNTSCDCINTCVVTPISSTSAICEGATLSLSISAIGGQAYSWSGPGSFSTTSQNPSRSSATVAMNGIYSVTVTGSSCTVSTSVSATVNAAPALVTTGTTVCLGSTIQLSASGGTLYSWSGPAAFTATGAAPIRAAASSAMAGVYSVTASGTNTCTQSATATVSVRTSPITTIIGDEVCVGETIILGLGLSGSSYSWSGPSSFSATVQNPTRASATTAMAGVYSVTVMGTNGCTASATTSVIVNTGTTSATGTSPVCEGQSIQLSTSSGSAYSWAGPGGFTATVQNPIRANATTSMGGLYSITVQSSSGCTGTNTVQIEVNAKPVGTIGAITVCEGGNLLLSSSGGTTYSWTGPANFYSTLANPVRTNASTAMTGAYTLTIVGSNNCTALYTTAAKVNANPAITLSGVTVCEGETITLSATGGGSYSWAGPSFSASTATPSIPNASIQAVGTYTVSITSTNSCTGSATTTVQVNTKPVVTATGGLFCSGGTISLSATGGGQYSWAGPQAFSSTLSNPTRSSATSGMAGIYTVTVTASNSCTQSATASVSISNVVITVAAVSPVCEGGSVSLNTSNGLSYSWAGPLSFSSSIQNPTRSNLTVAMAGLYSVTVVLDKGCTTSNTVSVVVNAKPTVLATSNASASPVCIGTTVQLSASGGTNYSWQGPNFYTASGASPIITNASLGANGVYTVSVTNSLSCTATATVSVGTYVCCSITVSASAVGACAGGTVSLNASAGAYSYSWAGPASFSSTLKNPTRALATAAMSGVYSVTVTLQGGTCTASATASLSVIEVIPAVSANQTVIEGFTIQLSASGGSSYSWSGPYGFYSTSQAPIRFNAISAMAGVYTVTVRDPNACSATATTSVAVLKALGSIGDYVWQDVNMNGLQDNGEPGVKNVKVELYKIESGALGSPVKTTFTDADGHYYFYQLPSGDYKVRFVPSSFPVGTSLTTQNAGNDLLDSDADANGYSPLFNINADGISLTKDNPTIDAGLISARYDISLEKFAFKNEYAIGDTLSFKLRVHNEGTLPVTGIQVKDILPAGVAYTVSTTTMGAYNSQTGIWNIDKLGVDEGAFLTIKVKVLAEGVWYNTAEVIKMNELDYDSTPNNGNESEDDIDRACISIPYQLCDGEVVIASAPDGLTGIQWFKNGVPIKNATASQLEISEPGSYTFTSIKASCSEGGCCPVIVKRIECCKPVCVPFLISKNK
ncbi:MAG: choice-of-anchor A family protein [Spirosomataceae bacterium]